MTWSALSNNASSNEPARMIRPASFLTHGSAHKAGVRTDWALDIGKTRERNPGRCAVLKEEALLENPNILLAMSGVTLVFAQPNLRMARKFQGSGPADKLKWSCDVLPGERADFEFSNDGGVVGEPEKRWGVWALVLP